MITRGTALEIYTNPYDLSIGVGRASETENYSLAICRGRGHNYKPLLTSKPWKETIESIILVVEGLLMQARNFCVNELKMSETDEFLNHDLIKLIIRKLHEH